MGLLVVLPFFYGLYRTIHTFHLYLEKKAQVTEKCIIYTKTGTTEIFGYACLTELLFIGSFVQSFVCSLPYTII